MKMRAVVLTEGGKDIGFGHIGRCLSLAQALEERGVSLRFIVRGDSSVEGILKNREYELFDWLKEKVFEYIDDSTIVIVDSYFGDSDFYRRLSGHCGIIVYIDDSRRRDFPRGIVVNPAAGVKKTSYPKQDGLTYLLGSDYALLRKEFWQVPSKTIGQDIQKVMLTFGGSDGVNLSSAILKFFAEKFPSWSKSVVIGSSFRSFEQIQEIKDEKTDLIIHPDANQMRNIMLDCDIAISGGGQTLYELARIGTPAIGICVADNQIQNLEGLAKQGTLEYIGWYNHPSFIQKLEQAIGCLEDINRRKTSSEASRKMIDGQGARRVSREVLSQFYKKVINIRRASVQDMNDVFSLSNDPLVRLNSFHPEVISWDTHQEWFQRKLKSNTTFFFVAYTEGIFCGQVRFETEKEEALIGISLKPFLRGLGLGSYIINEAIRLIEDCNSIKRVKALIKGDNTASIKAFQKAGFGFLADQLVEGYKASVYIKEI